MAKKSKVFDGSPAVETPPAPAHLSAEAAAWWARVLTSYDLADEALLILEGALEMFDRMREAQKHIATHGIVMTNERGMPHANPACRVEKDAKTSMLSHFRELGLNLEPLHATPGRPAGK